MQLLHAVCDDSMTAAGSDHASPVASAAAKHRHGHGTSNHRADRARPWQVVHQFIACNSGIHAMLDCQVIERLVCLLCGVQGYYKAYGNRLDAGNVLSKLLSHPQGGNRAATTLGQLVPEPVIQRLRDAPVIATSSATDMQSLKKTKEAAQGPIGAAGATQLWDENWETPELIWIATMRFDLHNALQNWLFNLEKNYKGNLENSCALKVGIPNGLTVSAAQPISAIPPTFSIRYTRLTTEVCIGGIYLQSFLRQPTSKLSRPLYSLDKLVETWEETVGALVRPPSVSNSADAGPASSFHELTVSIAKTFRASLGGGQLNHGEPLAQTVTIPSASYASFEKLPLLLLLTQAIIAVVRAEPLACGHLLAWGLPSVLATELAASCTYQSALARATQRGSIQKRNQDNPVSVLRQQYECNAVITCVLNLLELMCSHGNTAVQVIDDLADGSQPIVQLLLRTLTQGLPYPEEWYAYKGLLQLRLPLGRASAPIAISGVAVHQLPSYTMFVLKLLQVILSCEKSLRLLHYIQSVLSIGLPAFLMHSILCTSDEAFINVTVPQASSTGTLSQNAQTVRLQALGVLKMILLADEEMYYTDALRHALDSSSYWSDLCHHQLGLYAQTDVPLLSGYRVGEGSALHLEPLLVAPAAKNSRQRSSNPWDEADEVIYTNDITKTPNIAATPMAISTPVRHDQPGADDNDEGDSVWTDRLTPPHHGILTRFENTTWESVNDGHNKNAAVAITAASSSDISVTDVISSLDVHDKASTESPHQSTRFAMETPELHREKASISPDADSIAARKSVGSTDGIVSPPSAAIAASMFSTTAHVTIPSPPETSLPPSSPTTTADPEDVLNLLRQHHQRLSDQGLEQKRASKSQRQQRKQDQLRERHSSRGLSLSQYMHLPLLYEPGNGASIPVETVPSRRSSSGQRVESAAASVGPTRLSVGERLSNKPIVDSNTLPVSALSRLSVAVHRTSSGWGLDLAKLNKGDSPFHGGTVFVKYKHAVAEDFSQQNAHPNLFSASNGTLLPGDVIVAIDGTPCTAFTEAVQALRRHAADHAVLTIIREINKEYAS